MLSAQEARLAINTQRAADCAAILSDIGDTIKAAVGLKNDCCYRAVPQMYVQPVTKALEDLGYTVESTTNIHDESNLKITW